MPVLQGMELQVVWSDIARIMDLPLYDQQQQQQQQQETTSQQQQIMAILDEEAGSNKAGGGQIWANQLSPDSNGSNPEVMPDDVFPWSELKLPMPTVVGRKRKIWDQEQDGAPQVKVTQQQQLQILEEKMAVAARLRDRNRRQDVGTRLGEWQMDDLEAELDASSLSGLGVGLGNSNSYNMSETLLALPSLTVFKQEAPSPSANNDAGLPQQSPTSGVGEADSNTPNNSGVASQLHQLLQQHGTSVFSSNTVTTTTNQPQRHPLDSNVGQNAVGSTTGRVPMPDQGEGYQTHSSSSPASSASPSSGLQEPNIDCRFQYVLAAATSIATKVNEETLTYLNQGQSYEIKLKKLGELSAYRGKVLKSVIRICFHERRLQYMEREQMAAWQASRPGDRIVEVDVPLSYGLLDVVQDPQLLNTVEFLWDPTKEVGVYIKVNCISTEFTPKKHGGEKGVPFRIQVETFLQGESNTKRLHAAACQIKVFKLKGADRKHKQDREKILKRPASEQEKFQPSYECTVLNDIPSDAVFVAQPVTSTVSSSGASKAVFSPSDAHGAPGRTTTSPTNGSTLNSTAIVATKEETKPVVPTVVNSVLPDPAALAGIKDVPVYLQPLASEATAQQTTQWLQTHRFGSYLRTFSSFSGADLLRLSRDDLIQICGLPDGIRLYNALHSKTIAPRLTMYLCVEQSSVYHALYLDSLSCAEMACKLAQLLGVSSEQVRGVYLQGPNGIHVLITDEVVRNFKDEAMFAIEILQDASGEQYRLLLKPSPR